MQDANLLSLVQKIARERDFGFDAYKESCLRRRIAVRMRARGVTSYADYGRLLERDASEYERLLDTLTINVSKFYRNRETWDLLAGRVLPMLWADRRGRLRCWSAGCASGQESYTLAVLLSELERETDADMRAAWRIDATDFDRRSLDRAAQGVYPAEAFEEMPPLLTHRYFSGDALRTVVPELKRHVSFQRHDLTREPPPNPPYDLVMCRNVLIYFDKTTQQRLIAGFVDALRSGGYLVLGRAETLYGEVRKLLELEDTRERVYRKP